jgi:hypothetical protein
MTAGNRHYTGPGRPVMHGTKGLKHAVNTLGSRAIDRRTSMGRALAAWRSELLADLGGIDAVSTQELALVEEAVKTKLILDSVDAWLLSQATLINKRSRSVLPAVRDRQALVSTLRGLLGDLGLKRRSKAMPSLGEYLTQRTNGTGSNASQPQSDERDTGRTAHRAGAKHRSRRRRPDASASVRAARACGSPAIGSGAACADPGAAEPGLSLRQLHLARVEKRPAVLRGDILVHQGRRAGVWSVRAGELIAPLRGFALAYRF